VRFGAFELDESDARLLRDGTALTLAPRPFGLLCALARRAGSLLTKNELLDDVWGHQFVSESVLKTAISDLRTVLDDHPREPRFIETVSRRGYRFIASTTAIPSTVAISGKASVGTIEFQDQSHSKAVTRPSSACDGFCGDKRAALCAVPKVPVCRPEADCALPQPVFATMEEVCYAHQLRLKLRALLLRGAATAVEPCSAGVC
jgi:DNA-binding winged helix-turn-helix (wHTH) protein